MKGPNFGILTWTGQLSPCLKLDRQTHGWDVACLQSWVVVEVKHWGKQPTKRGRREEKHITLLTCSGDGRKHTMFVPNMQNVKKRALGEKVKVPFDCPSVWLSQQYIIISQDEWTRVCSFNQCRCCGSPKGSRIRVGTWNLELAVFFFGARVNHQHPEFTMHNGWMDGCVYW